VGSRCATITKAMPLSAGMAPKNFVSAPSPPADEPNATIGGTNSGSADLSGPLAEGARRAVSTPDRARRAGVLSERLIAIAWPDSPLPRRGGDDTGRVRPVARSRFERVRQACRGRPGARPLADAAPRSRGGTGSGRRTVPPPATACDGCPPQPETGAYVRRVETDRVTDGDEGVEPDAVVGGEPRLDIGEDGAAAVVGRHDVALKGSDGLFEDREQEALLGVSSSRERNCAGRTMSGSAVPGRIAHPSPSADRSRRCERDGHGHRRPVSSSTTTTISRIPPTLDGP